MIFVGIASYARPNVFALSVRSLLRAKVIGGIIAVIDARDPAELDRYLNVLNAVRSYGLEVLADAMVGRRGSTNARNRILDLAEQNLGKGDILVLYDDDYICPGSEALAAAVPWLRMKGVGLVGGRVVNLSRRGVDPDFYLNLAGVADGLTRLTGFIFLDVVHGPRYVDFTTPLMALRVDVVKRGIRYDPCYRGTAYREESDFQAQVRRLGYRIVFEPRFYVYHLCLEEGGNRVLNDAALRFYWKARNNTYFIRKHKMGMFRLAMSTAITTTYAMFNGFGALKAVRNGLVDGLKSKVEQCSPQTQLNQS